MNFVLRVEGSPGDVLAATVVPREIHRHFPFQHNVYIQSDYPDVWVSNPYVTSHFDEFKSADRTGMKIFDIKADESRFGHLTRMHAYVECANEELKGIGISDMELTELRPCLFFSPRETESRLATSGRARGMPYWCFHAGYSKGNTAARWDVAFWKRAIYKVASTPGFAPILAQIGRASRRYRHHSFDVNNTIRILNRTTVRQMIHLIRGSEGVITNPSLPMHIAAALGKPCVVVAGGTSNWWWDSYDLRMLEKFAPGIPDRYQVLLPLVWPHRYIDSIGTLMCCRTAKCGKTGIGDRPAPYNCIDIVQPTVAGLQEESQGRCMNHLHPDHVVQAVLEENRHYGAVQSATETSYRTP